MISTGSSQSTHLFFLEIAIGFLLGCLFTAGVMFIAMVGIMYAGLSIMGV